MCLRAANGLVVAKVRRRENMSTEIVHLEISPKVIAAQPDKVPDLVKQAVNEALQKVRSFIVQIQFVLVILLFVFFKKCS